MPIRPLLAYRVAAFAAAGLLLFSCSREPSRVGDSDVVVAQVNGAPITLQELKAEIASVHGRTLSASEHGTVPEVRGALRRLVEHSLVLQEGARRGITVSDSEVEEEVRRFRSDFPPGGLEKTLLQQGIGVDEWRGQMRRSILYKKSSEAIAGGPGEVPEEEVRETYRRQAGKEGLPERIRVRQLLFESAEEASRVRERILAGDSLDKAAGRASGEGAGPQVADLGELSREELPAEIAGELFGLPPGGVSRLVRRDKSVSFFLVGEKSPAGEVPFEKAAPRIREELLREQREEGFREWLSAEMAKADVKVREPILAGLEAKAK